MRQLRTGTRKALLGGAAATMWIALAVAGAAEDLMDVAPSNQIAEMGSALVQAEGLPQTLQNVENARRALGEAARYVVQPNAELGDGSEIYETVIEEVGAITRDWPVEAVSPGMMVFESCPPKCLNDELPSVLLGLTGEVQHLANQLQALPPAPATADIEELNESIGRIELYNEGLSSILQP